MTQMLAVLLHSKKRICSSPCLLCVGSPFVIEGSHIKVLHNSILNFQNSNIKQPYGVFETISTVNVPYKQNNALWLLNFKLAVTNFERTKGSQDTFEGL